MFLKRKQIFLSNSSVYLQIIAKPFIFNDKFSFKETLS